MITDNLIRSTLTFLSLFTLAPICHSLEAHVEYGLDSNAHKISSSPYSAEYRELRLEHSGKNRMKDKSSISYAVKLRDRQYEPNSSPADKFQFDSRLRWANRFKIGERTANLMVTADYRNVKKTYFNQLQRQVASTKNGDSLADRFNYNSAKLSAEMIYRFNKNKSLSLYGYIAKRDYLEDYQHLDMESLDFREYNLQPNFRYKSEHGLKARAFFYLRSRHYDQLLNDGHDGRNMDNSLLVYQMRGYGVVVAKPLSQRLSARLYVNGYQARDNGGGYRDMDYHKLDIGLDYDFGQDAALAVNTVVYTKNYLMDSGRAVDLQTGEVGRKRTGWRIEAEVKYPLMDVSGKPLYWFVKAVTLRERNSKDILSYSTGNFAVGLSYKF